MYKQFKMKNEKMTLFEMSTKDFQFKRVTSYPYQFGPDPILLHETFLESDQNGITFENDPVWVRIADPNAFGPRVNGALKLTIKKYTI